MLTGFYCCNAFSAGRELARRLHRPFIDVPSEIKRRQRLALFRLPASNPATSSRKLEEYVVRDMAYRRESVVVLGLDTLANEINNEELNVFSYLVFLDPPFPVLWERIQRSTGLSDQVLELGRNGFYDMWLALRPTYEQCDLQLFAPPTQPAFISKLISHCFYS